MRYTVHVPDHKWHLLSEFVTTHEPDPLVYHVTFDYSLFEGIRYWEVLVYSMLGGMLTEEDKAYLDLVFPSLPEGLPTGCIWGY